MILIAINKILKSEKSLFILPIDKKNYKEYYKVPDFRQIKEKSSVKPLN